MSNPINLAKEKVKGRRVNTFVGMGIVISMPVLIVVIGILSAQASFRWGATSVNKDGDIEYANSINLRGWEAVPFQAIAALVSTGVTAYGAYKLSTKPAEAKVIPEESEQQE